VEEFVYLGSLIHSTTQSSPDISRVMPSLVHYAEPGQSDIEVTNLHIHQVEAV